MNKDIIQNRDHFLRELLKNEFQRRAEKNPAFSLRALSSKLDMDQSLLTKLLQGKRKFSDANAQKISDFLGVYLNQEIANTIDSSADYLLMKEDEFFIISAWYHFAILELIKTKNLKHNPKFVAKRLKITDLEAERALERLERLGFIEFKKNKYWLRKISNSWLNLSDTSTARRTLQKQMQEKSLEALEDVPFDKREHSSLTVAVDPKLLPEIKKKITEFRRSMDKYIMESGNEKEVYNLNVSFFPLTKDLKIKE
ncbi:MAG: TIGR02147 family protein [Bdellovibrionota bacterium]